MIWLILMLVPEGLLFLVMAAMWADKLTTPPAEHKKSKPEVITVKVFVAEPKKTHTGGRHKATKGRHALAA